ncbi:MAG: hypothetical protein LBT89_02845, partial [Planctomycetaceae bacterium]|nr:hypothetical protein [Planctomycetaceae bacterium]
DEKFAVGREFGRLSAGFMELDVSGLQDMLHCAEDRLGRADDAFELFVRHLECFLDPFYKILLEKTIKLRKTDEL